jgi:transcriptional regulator with XRE-family HTH domain
MHLRDYMAQQGLKDDEVAAAIGVERATVNRYRNGAVTPRDEMKERIARWSKGKVPVQSWFAAVAAE